MDQIPRDLPLELLILVRLKLLRDESFVPLCRELFRAMVTIVLGQRQNEGYTRNFLRRPASPYPYQNMRKYVSENLRGEGIPMKSVDNANRIW